MADTAFDRHPVLTLTFFTFFLLILITGIAEIALRFTIPYDIGYYSAVKQQGKYEYPYGTIYMNEDGFPDEEFNLTSAKKRIGYFGDSVTFGVGAGSSYRFSDLLQDQYPQYEHWTFSMLANGVQDDKLNRIAKKYDLDYAVYAMNLNDILPRNEKKVKAENADSQPILPSIRKWARNHIDGMRGKSYFYNWVRTSVKNALERGGYGHTGFKTAELFPHENEDLIKDVAQRVNAIGAKLKNQGVIFCVIILPYEMQISEAAAETYSNMGIHWEDGFTDGSTQDLLRKDLDNRFLYDGMKAFQKVKSAAKTGEYFVYDKGDKVDFNHPNRAGHALLTKGFAASRACPFL